MSPDTDPLSRRIHDRKSVVCDARVITHTGEEVECRILNISAGGASVEVDFPLTDGEPVTLRIGALGDHVCDVIWINGFRLGLNFHDGPEMMAEVVMALAMYG
jgi:hypothetical protein